MSFFHSSRGCPGGCREGGDTASHARTGRDGLPGASEALRMVWRSCSDQALTPCKTRRDGKGFMTLEYVCH